MEFESVKSDKIDQLPFIDSSIIENGGLKSFVIKFAGKLYSINTHYNGLTISQPKPDSIVEKYQVTGEILGIEIKPVFFDDQRSADRFVGDHPYNSELKITTVKYNETKDAMAPAVSILRATDDVDLDVIPF